MASHRPHTDRPLRSLSRSPAPSAYGRPCPFRPRFGGTVLNRLHVIAPGFLTTVQDLGRFGWAHFGISASGAADPVSFRAANLLVGNTENAPALEMTLAGGEFTFEAPAIVAVTGSDFSSPVPLWQPVEITAGATLRFGPSRSGARCYLAVRGGFDVPVVMGSASVHVMTGVGGRPLRKGDALPV